MDYNDIDSDLGGEPGNEQEKVIMRDVPQPDAARAALVEKWQKEVTGSKEHFKDQFEQMRKDQQFVRGKQWDNGSNQYVANIAHRHVQQKTAFLYAKNPKAIARVRPRLLGQVWDGTNAQIQMAQMALQQAMMAGMPPAQEAQIVLEEAEKARSHRQMLRRVGATLSNLYEYNIDEQVHPFKQMMKSTVRRTITTGVGYVKLGYQRVMQLRPDVQSKIADYTERLHKLEQLAADMADGELDKEHAEAEQLRLMIQSLEQEKEVLLREGLTFDYPDSTSIIPDKKCKSLRTFAGCDWVAQEYLLPPETVQSIYGVDIGKSYRGYSRSAAGDNSGIEAQVIARMEGRSDEDNAPEGSEALVWEIYCRSDGLVYVIADGYPEFLQEPSSPDVYLERFWPWFPVIFNEVDDPSNVFPPSDVSLLRDMQSEYNRSRQGLREHRKANRPKIAVASGMLDEDDVNKLKNHPANAVLELNALAPGQSIDEVLQVIKNPPIDPALYEVNSVYEDVLRVVGVQEATLGGVSGATATETNIAQSSQASATQSNVDDLDETLTLLARSAGQILFAESSLETVKRIVGEGAVWPAMSRKDIAEEIFLEIEAGSMGRPNQAQEIQNAERIFPLLMQIQGISQEFLATELLRRLDDKLDVTEAFATNMPSTVALNQNSGPPQGDPDAQPEAQGAEGGQNTPVPTADGPGMGPNNEALGPEMMQ